MVLNGVCRFLFHHVKKLRIGGLVACIGAWVGFSFRHDNVFYFILLLRLLLLKN
jgi:hypothetical protein